jgi:hypothetical protein
MPTSLGETTSRGWHVCCLGVARKQGGDELPGASILFFFFFLLTVSALDRRHFHRAAFSATLKAKVSSTLTKAAALHITLNIDGVFVTSRTHTRETYPKTRQVDRRKEHGEDEGNDST